MKRWTLRKAGYIFVPLSILIILGLNITPLVAHIRHAPTGRTFAFIHNNAQDFYFYNALMNEGKGGAWLTYDPYTHEQHRSSIIFSYFLWLGKLAGLFHMPTAVLYHTVRLLFGAATVGAAWILIKRFGIPYPRLTFLFFLFAAPFLHTIPDGDKVITVPFMHWWTGMDPVRRFAYLPHHMVGSFLLITSFLLLTAFVQSKKKKFLLWAGACIPILAFIHTPSLFIILLILPIAGIIYFLPRYKNWYCIGLLVLYWFIGLFSLVFMLSQTGKGFPWSQYIEWEKTLQFPVPQELIGALGILTPFAVLGAARALSSASFPLILSACWLFVPFAFLPLARTLGFSNIRLIQGTPYLPLSILAVLGIKTLEEMIGIILLKLYKNPKFKVQSSNQVQNPKHLALRHLRLIWHLKFELGNFLSPIFAFTLFTVATFPTLQWSLKDQVREYWPIFGNIYIDNRLFSAFDFIDKNYPPRTVVLSTFYTGNYLPAYTHISTYLGHFGYTMDTNTKEKETNEFFSGKMPLEKAHALLKRNTITLVFQGPEEKPLFNDKLYPAILKPVYDTQEATIYSLK